MKIRIPFNFLHGTIIYLAEKRLGQDWSYTPKKSSDFIWSRVYYYSDRL